MNKKTRILSGLTVGAAVDPEEFYRQHIVSGLRGVLFERRVSQAMTGRAARIRREEEL